MRGRARFVAAAPCALLCAAFALGAVPQAADPKAAVPKGVRSPQQPAAAHSVTDYRAVVDRYCVTCHNERTKTAGLTLDTMDLSNVAGRRRRVGESRAQGPGRDDAAARGAASGPGHGARAGVVPHDRARSRVALEAESRTRPDSPSESRGIRQRHPRSLRARRRHVVDAAARRCGLRLRQHRRRARDVARAARALSDGGRQDHVAGGRRS